MADPSSSSSPLLVSELDDEGSNRIKHEETSKLVTFDKIMEQSSSGFGSPHLIQTILVAFAMFFDSQLTFINIYTDAYPTWHCVDRSICDPATSDICELPRSSWDWNGGGGKSVISDFGLECSSSWLRNMPTTFFFVGSIVGGFLLAMIPENLFGRKIRLVLSTLAMSLTGIAASFSPNIWIYTCLKFLIGSVRSLLGTYVTVLILESVPARWRPRAGMIPLTLYVLGFMSLSGLSYVLRNASSWRVLYLCTSIPAALHSLFLYLLAFESPLWLDMVGRKEEAMNVLGKISTVNESALESIFSRLNIEEESRERGHDHSIKDLFVRRWALKRILAVMVTGFGIGMAYHGVPFVVGDNYIDETLNGLVELPSFVLAPILLEKFNRRSSLLVNNLLGIMSGVSCFVLSILRKGKAAFVFQLASSFFSRMGINLMTIYTVEMFPTCVRNSAAAMAAQAQVIGAVLSPIISPLGRSDLLLSAAIFASCACAVSVVVSALPETKDSNLCDTMEEQEQIETKPPCSKQC